MKFSLNRALKCHVFTHFNKFFNYIIRSTWTTAIALKNTRFICDKILFLSRKQLPLIPSQAVYVSRIFNSEQDTKQEIK